MNEDDDDLPCLELALADRQALAEAYMPRLRRGGLFVPTSAQLPLAAAVRLRVRLPAGEPVQVQGRVAWITPAAAQDGQPPGLGVQFADSPLALALRQRIEDELGELAADGPPSQPM